MVIKFMKIWVWMLTLNPTYVKFMTFMTGLSLVSFTLTLQPEEASVGLLECSLMGEKCDVC